MIMAFLANARRSGKRQWDTPESSRLAFLNGELDPLARKLLLQLIKTHELIKIISSLKL